MKFDIGKQFIITGIIGVLFVITLIVIAFTVECPTEFQNQIFKIVMALASGAFAAMIPGAININYKGLVTASGAVAVFVMVYFFSPQTLLDSSLCSQEVEFRGVVSVSGKPAKDIDIFIQDTDQLVHTNKIGKFSLSLPTSKPPSKLTLYCQSDESGIDTVVYVPSRQLSGIVSINLKEGKQAPTIQYRGNVYIDGIPLQDAMVVMPQLRTETSTDEYGFFNILPDDRISEGDIKMIIRHEMERINESIDVPESELIAYADINVTAFEDTTQESPRILVVNPVTPVASELTKPVVEDVNEPMETSSIPAVTGSAPTKAEHCLVCIQFDAEGKSQNIREKCNSDLKYLKDYIAGYAKASEEQGLKYTCKFRTEGALDTNRTLGTLSPNGR